MSGRTENEGFDTIEEFICDAIPGPGIPKAEFRQGGENEGIRDVEECIIDIGGEVP
jgi:hypothetical protein